jgi:hypothetical protein
MSSGSARNQRTLETRKGIRNHRKMLRCEFEKAESRVVRAESAIKFANIARALRHRHHRASGRSAIKSANIAHTLRHRHHQASESGESESGESVSGESVSSAKSAAENREYALLAAQQNLNWQVTKRSQMDKAGVVLIDVQGESQTDTRNPNPNPYQYQLSFRGRMWNSECRRDEMQNAAGVGKRAGLKAVASAATREIAAAPETSTRRRNQIRESRSPESASPESWGIKGASPRRRSPRRRSPRKWEPASRGRTPRREVRPLRTQRRNPPRESEPASSDMQTRPEVRTAKKMLHPPSAR